MADIVVSISYYMHCDPNLVNKGKNSATVQGPLICVCVCVCGMVFNVILFIFRVVELKHS